MLIFCPDCGTLLKLGTGDTSLQYSCPTCDYKYKVRKTISSRKFTELKEVDEVLSDSSSWLNVDSTEEKCPKCEHPKAYFMQLQTRSADEPMTTFYRCCKEDCAFRWKE